MVMIKTLIVEDSQIYRTSLHNMLRERYPNMDVVESPNGEDALRVISDMIPDLIFMDISLPGKNGLEITKKIKSMHSEIIVIILTNNDLPEYQEAAYQNGANHFLSKSCSADDILSLVENVHSTCISRHLS